MSSSARRPHAVTDPIGALLSTLRARAVVVLHDVYRGDWAIEIPSRDHLAEYARADPHDVLAAFHIVQHGTAAIVRPGRHRTLHEGDVFLALQPDAHVLRGLGAAVVPTPLEHLLTTIPPKPVVTSPQRAEDTAVLCGLFVLERAASTPLGRHLRSDIHLPGNQRRHGTALSDVMTATARHEPGWQFTTSRLLELLLADALTSDPAHVPFAAAVDDFVHRATELIDDDPTQAWTVEDLASACAVSPSWLSARFRATLDTSPMRHVHDRRLALAADLLLRTEVSVERAGHEVGFANQPAFTRAFKRRYGAPPSQWRTSERDKLDRRDPPADRV